jgi:hypothetical protein
MIEHLSASMKNLKDENSQIGTECDIAMEKSFIKKIIQNLKKKVKNLVSKRGEKTYVFPYKDTNSYHDLVNDPKRFRVEVLDKLDKYAHTTGHKSSCKCKGHKKYTLCGFRKNNRNTIMNNGKQEIFRIRMVECVDCGQKFSLLPSFLPREKNFGIDIIGNVCQNMCLFCQSIQGAIENLKIIGENSVKSRQTILNWILWMGTHHPATILTRSGIAV